MPIIGAVRVVDAQQLLAWNGRGLIPAPHESEEAFLQRVEISLQSSQHNAELPNVPQALSALSKRYDIAPDWVSVLYSNEGLGLWHGGGTIIELKAGSAIPTIQLRRSLRNRARYLGIYRVEEFLEHEYAHAGRIAFQENEFEEILAYRTSANAFRRWFGPIVRSSKEVWILLLTLILAVGVDYFFFAMGWLEAGLWALFFYFIPVGLIGFALLRLGRSQRRFRAALSQLGQLTSRSEAVIYRLSDDEIRRFAKASLSEIREYVAQQSSLRWQLIRTAYLLPR